MNISNMYENLTIPKYQRKYAWSNTPVNELRTMSSKSINGDEKHEEY